MTTFSTDSKMEEQLSILKRTFGEIVDLKEGNFAILQSLETRIKKIKDMYSEFIHTNRDKVFVFTLDSFHFQRKLIDLEYEDMNRMFLSITNRMYCDYYKLFKIMVEYVREHIPDTKLADLIKLHDNFPIYKDLEPFKQYDFQYIQGLHEIILVILGYIHTYITNKEHDLKVYQTKNQIGLNIDSFVSTFSFNIVVINQQAVLFINYIEFFHKIHTKYLKRFTTKLNLMLSQINNDIKLDNPKDTASVKTDTINDLREHGLDRDLLREIKVSISDEVSISSDSSGEGSAGVPAASSSPEDFFNTIPSEITEDDAPIESLVELAAVQESFEEPDSGTSNDPWAKPESPESQEEEDEPFLSFYSSPLELNQTATVVVSNDVFSM